MQEAESLSSRHRLKDNGQRRFSRKNTQRQQLSKYAAHLAALGVGHRRPTFPESAPADTRATSGRKTREDERSCKCGKGKPHERAYGLKFAAALAVIEIWSSKDAVAIDVILKMMLVRS